MALSEDEKALIEAAAEGAIKALANKIPAVYTDLLQPGTRVLGKGIEDIVKLALLPVSATVWVGVLLNYFPFLCMCGFSDGVLPGVSLLSR